MSVQAGIWNFDGMPVEDKLLATFGGLMKEQGPDGESAYLERSMAMLYRPFHTTAESRREKQPYRSQRGSFFTWDGRLDNRNDLIGDLRCELSHDPTDLEIVAAAFDRWESDCFHRIVGDWAVSIWRPALQELVLSSDYIGVRHIFYHLNTKSIRWATNLAPLVTLSEGKLHVDDEYIAGYLAHDPDACQTPYQELREVPPGQSVRVRNGVCIVERYWRFSPKSRIRYKTDVEYEEHFRCFLRQSVRRRLRIDTPLLAELSGGLDSSSIVCVADDILAKEGAQTPRLDTLSYYDRTEPQGDDWLYFPIIEEKRGKVGYHLDTSKLVGTPVSFEYPEFEPLPGFLGAGRELEVERADLIRGGGYRVILSGIGGDEFLGGVPDPSDQLADLIVQCKFRKLAQQLIAWSLVKRRPWIHLLCQALANLLPSSVAQHVVKRAKVEPWIENGFANRTRLSMRLLDVDNHFKCLLPTRRSCARGVILMANKLSKWEPSRLAPEETRYPYLDQNLIEFIFAIPATQLLRAGERRSLMRRSLIRIVPLEILERKTKQFGARTPVVAVEKSWNELRTIFESALSSRFGYINQHRFLATVHDARNGKQIHTVRMLRTISLEFWLHDLVRRRLIDPPEGSHALGVPVSAEASV